jgi:hypothetical protein
MLWKKLTIAALGAGFGASLYANSALADDPIHYCHWYAHTAIEQAHAARAVWPCHHFIDETPNRWTLDWGAHYDWCLSVFGSGANASEHQIRAENLNQCVNRM